MKGETWQQNRFVCKFLYPAAFSAAEKLIFRAETTKSELWTDGAFLAVLISMKEFLKYKQK